MSEIVLHIQIPGLASAYLTSIVFFLQPFLSRYKFNGYSRCNFHGYVFVRQEVSLHARHNAHFDTKLN